MDTAPMLERKVVSDQFRPPKVTYRSPDGRIADLPTIPQDNIDKFYSLAGFIINNWALVDRSLFSCFHAALKVTEHQAAILYYAWSNIGSRIGLLNDILVATLPDHPILPDWKKLKDSFDLSTRNLLAHHPIEIESAYRLNEDGSFTTTHTMRAKFEEKELLAGKKRDKVVSYADLLAALKKAEETHQQVQIFRDRLIDAMK
jgi:hypothetical protein